MDAIENSKRPHMRLTITKLFPNVVWLALVYLYWWLTEIEGLVSGYEAEMEMIKNKFSRHEVSFWY